MILLCYRNDPKLQKIRALKLNKKLNMLLSKSKSNEQGELKSLLSNYKAHAALDFCIAVK